MVTEVVDPENPEASVIRHAATILARGGLVAFPTETVYGLGANALDDSAVQRIFDTKGRPAYNPLIVHVASAEEARRWAVTWPASAAALAARFWPGPLTLVLPKREQISDRVTAGLPTVALRVPRHPVALALLREADVPIAAPSANRFTRLSPTTAEHVLHGFDSGVDLILDAGPTRVGIESTVVDLSVDHPLLLRPGTIPRGELEEVLGPLTMPEAGGDDTAPRRSPGMTLKHYSPRAELRVFAQNERGEMERTARREMGAGRSVGALLLHRLDAPLAHSMMMPSDPGGYAANLYAELHRMDDVGCEVVLADAVPEGVEWAGVRDRLTRAARVE